MIPPPPGIGISRAWITRGRDLQAKIVQTKPSSPSKPNHPSVMSIYSLTYIHWTFFVSSLLSKLNCFFSLWNSTMFFPTSPPNPTKFLSSLSIQSQRCLSPAFIKTSLSCSFFCWNSHYHLPPPPHPTPGSFQVVTFPRIGPRENSPIVYPLYVIVPQ